MILNQFFPCQEKRHCSLATVSNHISSTMYVIKFLHHNDVTHFNDVAITRQLRVQATLIQREGDLECPWSKEDLRTQNHWFPW